jgi:hypothetical protein
VNGGTWQQRTEVLWKSTPEREQSLVSDYGRQLLDDNPEEPWSLSYSKATEEAYVCRVEPDGQHRFETESAPRFNDWPTARRMSPLYILGYLPEEVAGLALGPTDAMNGRMGALAWVYQRVKLVEAMVGALRSSTPEDTTRYLQKVNAAGSVHPGT